MRKTIKKGLKDVSEHDHSLMLLNWHEKEKKSELKIRDRLCEYINSFIYPPYSVGDSYRHKLGLLVREYGINEVINAIDISSNRYLKSDRTNALTFIEKIPGILYLRKQGKLAQQISKLKYYGKSTFGYWDQKKASILINNAVASMKQEGFSEGAIIDELSHLIEVTKRCRHWSQWRGYLEDHYL